VQVDGRDIRVSSCHGADHQGRSQLPAQEPAGCIDLILIDLRQRPVHEGYVVEVPALPFNRPVQADPDVI